jgi:MFS family permease
MTVALTGEAIGRGLQVPTAMATVARANSVVGMLQSLRACAVGHFVRPVGGVRFGCFGDRIDSKASLMRTVRVVALGTFALSLLASYSPMSVWASAMLVSLCLIQGIGLGWGSGGASLMAVEQTPWHRQGLRGSAVQFGGPLGLVTSYRILVPDERRSFLVAAGHAAHPLGSYSISRNGSCREAKGKRRNVGVNVL